MIYLDAGNDKNQMFSNQFVQEAVLQCVHKLRQQQPHIRVGLITFNNLVQNNQKYISISCISADNSH